MSEDVWSARDTTPEAIDKALRDLLRRRHAENPSLAPARVLNLVVVVDRSWKGDVSDRLERVGRYHASRTVLCAVEEGRSTLDAVAAMGWAEPTAGTISVMREQVEIDLGPQHLLALDTIVDPVIVSELPTMLWCPHGHHEATDALREMVDVILLDSDTGEDAASALAEAAKLARFAYVVDLAWMRSIPWRERLAASFDPPDRLAELSQLDSVAIRYSSGSLASALLLAGWLTSRLGWQPAGLRFLNGRGAKGMARRGSAEVEISLAPHRQDAPGLAGVTVGSDHSFSLALDRSGGGLRAHENADGEKRSWKILGASRGEGGILGEGVRQALLRDPTYAPALRDAMELCA